MSDKYATITVYVLLGMVMVQAIVKKKLGFHYEESVIALLKECSNTNILRGTRFFSRFFFYIVYLSYLYFYSLVITMTQAKHSG